MKVSRPSITWLMARIPVLLTLAAILVGLTVTRESLSWQKTEHPALSTVIGYSSSAFCYQDKENTQTAARLWANLVMRKRNGTAETRIFQNQAELDRQLKTGKVDLIVLLPNEYLTLANRSLVEPLYISTRTKELYEALLLVTRKDNGISSVRGLKGKTLIHPKGSPNAVHRLWLEILTMRHGIRDPERYFSSIKDVISSSQALMPVFFRRADACVITRNSFNLMAELNPQLRDQLRVIEETAPMAMALVCIRKSCDQWKREQLIEILDTLDHTTEGKQLLTLFRMSRLIPFRQTYITENEAFLKQHSELKNTLILRGL